MTSQYSSYWNHVRLLSIMHKEKNKLKHACHTQKIVADSTILKYTTRPDLPSRQALYEDCLKER